MLDRAVDQIRTAGVDRADEILAPVQARCPDAAGPLAELAGARFAQHRYADSTALARRALERDAANRYATTILGASLFMRDDHSGALRAWNRIGEPRLDLVRISGLRRSRYQAIAETLALQPDRLLTADAFEQAGHRLDDLPDRTSSRLSLRPEPDGYASVDVAIAERPGAPRRPIEWAGAAIEAAVDREAAVAIPGFTGEGEVWSASWRWWANRPRVAVGLAAPRMGGLRGVWRVDGSWEAETYRFDDAGAARESHSHAALSTNDWLSGTIRYSVTGRFDSWTDRHRAIGIGASLERRWMHDTLSAAADVASWTPAASSSSAFSSVGVRGIARSSPLPRAWAWSIAAGAIRVTDAAPLWAWPGAGEGRARAPLLRAHPLLDDGIIDAAGDATFGRSLQYTTMEAQRWLPRPSLVRFALAAFVDAARAARTSRQQANDAPVTRADIGAGLRIRIPGASRILRIDFAHGLTDGTNAVSVGTSLTW